MFLTDMHEGTYHFIFKKYPYARYKLMNILQSFKNDLVIIDTQLLLWGENALSTELNFFLWIHFVAINNLFLYIINTQNKINGRPHHFITYYTSRAKPPNANPHRANECLVQNHPVRKHDQRETTWIHCNNHTHLTHKESILLFIFTFFKQIISVCYAYIYIIPCIWMRIVTTT